MPKQKTNKSVKKRIKITGTGKLVRNRPGRRHLLTAKSTKTKRNLRRQQVVSPGLSKKYNDSIAQ